MSFTYAFFARGIADGAHVEVAAQGAIERSRSSQVAAGDPAAANGETARPWHRLVSRHDRRPHRPGRWRAVRAWTSTRAPPGCDAPRLLRLAIATADLF
jgi:hypothetical protein